MKTKDKTSIISMLEASENNSIFLRKKLHEWEKHNHSFQETIYNIDNIDLCDIDNIDSLIKKLQELERTFKKIKKDVQRTLIKAKQVIKE